ncbi:hypothetical protein ABEB36_008580 [Hypothenemus hampei]|uniref:THAP-type domain-containing protein n=1 Tax=Hypothenemus hampei TaxID=57062 RepID=A0ABD1EMC8_HYPHA
MIENGPSEIGILQTSNISQYPSINEINPQKLKLIQEKAKNSNSNKNNLINSTLKENSTAVGSPKGLQVLLLSKMMQPRFRTAFCLVCGLQEHEVGRLHCFPSVQDRCRLWQEKMNMVFTGNTLHHHRICCNHFTEDQYVNRINWRLRRDAVPTLLPCSTVQRHLSITGESQIHKPETSTSMTIPYHTYTN